MLKTPKFALKRSVRNKTQARSTSIERRRRESLEAKDERTSFLLEAQEVLRSKTILHSPRHHEGANTIFLTNKKLSLDKRLGLSGQFF